MASIQEHLDKIKNAVFGKDVRQSIHDGLHEINQETESTSKKQEKLERTFDDLIINAGNSNAEVAAARNGFETLGKRLDGVDSQLDTIEKDLYTRKFRPKLVQNLYIRNELSNPTVSRDKELIKTDVENLKDFGVEALWLAIHVGYDEDTNDLYYQTNLDTLDYVFNELSINYNIPIIGVKFHQDWVISNIFAMGEEEFKNRIKSMFTEIATRYKGKFQYFGVFNEWRHFYKKNGFTYNDTQYNYVPFVIECINLVQSYGYKASVSIAGCSPSGWSSWNECDKSILDVSKVILMNGYPPVGNKSNYPIGDTSTYTLEDTKNAWNVYGAKDVINELLNRYGTSKKLIITESGTPDSFRNYFAPSNTSLSNPNISEANGEAVSLYLEGMFESNYKNSEMLEAIVWWFNITRGLEKTKKLINKYIYGGV